MEGLKETKSSCGELRRCRTTPPNHVDRTKLPTRKHCDSWYKYMDIHTETYFTVSRISKWLQGFCSSTLQLEPGFCPSIAMLGSWEPMILKMMLGTALHRWRKNTSSQATVGFSENEVSILFCYWAACVCLTVTVNKNPGSPRPNKAWYMDDPCKGFPTTKGQSLVFGLPGKIWQTIMQIDWPCFCVRVTYGRRLGETASELSGKIVFSIFFGRMFPAPICSESRTFHDNYFLPYAWSFAGPCRNW